MFYTWSEYISRGVLPFKLALLCWLFWPTMTKNNKGNLFVFEVGPCVKFVSAIKDAIFNKKNGGKFFFLKKMPNWGVRGEFGKRPHFFRFFFLATFPKSLLFFGLQITNVYISNLLQIFFKCLANFSFFVNKMSLHINVKWQMAWYVKCQMSLHINVKCHGINVKCHGILMSNVKVQKSND